MKNVSIRLLFFCISLNLILSCKKDGLTKATQNGANTFSCKVDGNTYKAQLGASLSTSSPISVYNLEQAGFVISTIDSRTGNPISTRILIQLPYLETTGTYPLNNYPSYGQYEFNYSPSPRYRTNTSHTGSVKITRCDNVNQIYSGTFSFKAIDDSTGKVVTVTDGRFDVKR